MINLDELKLITSQELLEKLYGKNLETKKDVLEYIERTKILKGEGVPQELIDDTYKLIDESIDNMKSKVKPNTIMFLKNTLKSSLGKLVKEKKENKPESGFIKFFKKAFEASRDVEICTNIVMCYLNINDLENAKLHLDIAKNLNPDDEIVKQLDTMINKEQ